MLLQDRTVVVTGASQGIGLGIARACAAAGARVALVARSADRLAPLAAELGNGAAAFACHVEDAPQVQATTESIQSQMGDIHGLVNNAGIARDGLLVRMTQDAWNEVIAVNLTGTFFLIRAVLPGMRRIGRGRITIIASEFGVLGWANATAYAASKAGLISLTKTLGRELGPEGILVNALAPGIMNTPQLDVDAEDAGVSPEEIRRRYAEDVPIGRIGEPEEMAALVAFLSSEGGGAFVGQILHPNGGFSRALA